jgi:hypothetical protein
VYTHTLKLMAVLLLALGTGKTGFAQTLLHCDSLEITVGPAGKLVRQEALQLEEGHSEYPLLESAHWPAGVYFYRLDSGGIHLSGKWVKLK